MTYKLCPKGADGIPSNSILRKEDGAVIPNDNANTDYAEYLEWVAAGNTPEAAD